MDLRRLQYFLSVVEHGTVTAAAATLHITQPSLSQAIQNLERDLDVELFYREGRGLTPTPAGLALVEPARRVLRDMGVVRAAVDDVRELSAGWLDVAAPDLLGRDPMATVLATFHRRHARVPVRVHEPRDEDDLVRMLLDGACELALCFLPIGQTGLTIHPLGEQEVWVVLPPGTPTGPNPLDVGELDALPVIEAIRGFPPSRLVRAALLAVGARPRPVIRSRHREAVIPLVLAGCGMAFTFSRYAQEAGRAGAVIRQLSPTITCPFGVVHRPGGLSPAARRFLQVIRETVEEN